MGGRGTDEERGNERAEIKRGKKKKRERERVRDRQEGGGAKCSGENRERKRGRRRIVGDGEGGEGGGDGGERGARSEAGGGGTGRRGVVLTRTGAFLIIICLSLGISREERGKPRGEWRRNGGGRRVPRKKRARMVEKEGAGPWMKERKRGRGPPKESQGSERKRARKRDKERGIDGRERARVRARGQRGKGRERFLLRPASKMALAAAPLVIKINN